MKTRTSLLIFVLVGFVLLEAAGDDDAVVDSTTSASETEEETDLPGTDFLSSLQEVILLLNDADKQKHLWDVAANAAYFVANWEDSMEVHNKTAAEDNLSEIEKLIPQFTDVASPEMDARIEERFNRLKESTKELQD
ncbi:uncharacterized protein [Periplaneta americana]|uniref:uncharacterized protein n=1 Tax=Periplaneta americana TaxID=6978 RepID=UPI0037E7BAA5